MVVFLADGFEEIEALSPVDYLRRAGVDVITVAVTSSDPQDKKIVKSSHNIRVFADTTLEEFLSSSEGRLPDAVFLPGGGNGAKNLAASKEVAEICKKCFAEGKLVSAICASPAVVLSPLGILKDKNWTCYPGMEETDVDPENVENSTHCAGVPFVSDGNLVTGAGPGASEQFAMELVRILAGEDIAKKVHDGSVQR